MATLFSKLSEIDNKTKYGVYGWIRKAELELKITHIPLMISNICILYYFEHEIFDIVSKDVKKSIDGKSITKMNNTWKNTNYGIIEIESNADNIYQWDFKIKKAMNYNILIGIMDSNQLIQDNAYFMCEAKKVSYVQYGGGYTYDTTNQTWPNFTRKSEWEFKQNDKVSMILNLKSSKLTFIINDKVEINAYDNIPKSDDIKYKMFVTLLNKDDCVQILDLSKQ